ncbi:hypothetical protein Agub_g10172 [Astrephomene gubernaculifera]|uniref:Glycerophosphocholine acyltransferase 1 n=1 Tax=Astrephomene gubernaculifera TaxID=47775 RepID=A0AAD3DVA7_9CHLO|nr:hypothetical protein Agub_g10172 [Astrephomene gubernaculifera]
MGGQAIDVDQASARQAMHSASQKPVKRNNVGIHAFSCTAPVEGLPARNHGCGSPTSAALLDDIACGLASHGDSLFFTGGAVFLCLLNFILGFAPALCPLLYLLFAAVCLPYRVVNFTKRKWTFFLVDFCYFANIACCTFLILRPEDPRLEAAVYVLCEGPLAAALIAWQCAWLLGSPDHAISVLIHQLPGLALFCHRFLAHTRRPLLLLTQIASALLSPQPTSPQDGATRLALAIGVARGRVTCPAGAGDTCLTAADSSGSSGGDGVGVEGITAGAATAGVCE